MDSEPENPDQTEDFIRLLTQHDAALTAYVLTLVPSRADAQDILQDTKIALWRMFEDFEPGTNFGAWARKAALFRVLDHRKKKAREDQRLWFSEECYERIAEAYEVHSDGIEARNEGLKQCISRLQPQHRDILIQRYFRDASIEDVAARANRTVEATYRVLSRIRLALRQCLNQGATT